MSRIGLQQEDYDAFVDSSNIGKKVDKLNKAKSEKVKRLGSYVGNNKLAKTGVLKDGVLENELSGDEFMGMVGSAYANEGLLVDDRGMYRMEGDTRLEYEGPATWLYMNPTKGSEEYVKPGVSNELNPDNRYDKSVHPTWEMGTEGADTSSSKDKMRLLLPTDTAYTLEALGLDRANAQEDRVVNQIGTKKAEGLFGDGKTEYFDSAENYFGASETRKNVDYDDLYNRLQDYKERVVPGGIGSSLTNNTVNAVDADTLLKSREGFVDSTYLDSLGKPTAGYGHLLSEEEQKMYPVGTKIPQEQLEAWYKEDSLQAKKAARDQMKELGLGKEAFATLTSMNYQLGTNWTEEWPDTVKAIKEGDYATAINNIANSKWAEQTPERAKDAINMLQGGVVDTSVSGGKDYEAIADRLDQERKQEEAKNAGTLDKLGNAVNSFQATIAKEVGVDFADWVGEGLDRITGGTVGWDIGTNEYKRDLVNDAFGVNEYIDLDKKQKAAELGRKIQADLVSDSKSIDLADISELIYIGASTPSIAADSLAFVASTFVPILGWGGKAAKAGKAIRGIEKLHKAGRISTGAAKKMVATAKTDVTILNKTTGFLQKSAGLLQVSAGEVNDQIEEYVKEHGEPPSIGKIAQMYVTSTLLLSLDRGALMGIIKSPAMVKEIESAFNAIPVEGKTKVLAKGLAVTGGLAANMGKEAGQEYLQSLGETLNVKWNFDDNGDFVSAVDEVGKVLLSTEAQSEAITGAGLGAGGAVQFAGIGAVGQGLQKVTGKVQQNIANRQNSKDTLVTPNEIDEGKEFTAEAASTSIDRLSYTLSTPNVGITDKNLDIVLNDVSNVKEFLDSLEGVEGVEKDFNHVKDVYEKGIDSLEGFVRTNPNIKLTKRMIEKIGGDEKVLGSEKIKKFKSTLEEADYNDTTRAIVAEELGHTILGSKRVYDEEFKTNLSSLMVVNGVDKDRAIEVIKTYDNIRSEATDEERGYMTYENKIQSTLVSGKPNKNVIKRNYSRLVSFKDSTDQSIRDIKNSKEEAVVQAAKFNKLPNLSTSKAKQIKSTYKKIRTRADGTPIKKKGKYLTEPYIINVKYNDSSKKWEPDFVDLDKRLAEKVNTLKGINKAIRTVTPGVMKATDGEVVATSFVKPEVVPGLSSGAVKGTKADSNYYSNKEQKISRVIGKDLSISKVILDEDKNNHKPKWSPGNNYHNLNKHVINTFENSGKEEGYTQDDVALVHAFGTFTAKDGKIRRNTLTSNKDEIVANEFKAAIKGKASIVLDTDYVSLSDKDKKEKLASIIQVLNKANYKRLGKEYVFIHEDVANETELEAIAEEKRITAEKKKNEKDAIEKAADLYLRKEQGIDAEGKKVDNIKGLEKEFNELSEEVRKKATVKAAQLVNATKKAIINEVPAGDAPKSRAHVNKAAEAKIASQLGNEEASVEMLSKWQELLDSDLEGGKLDEALNALFVNNDIDKEVREEFTDWLADNSIAKGLPDLTLRINKVQTTKEGKVTTQIRGVPLWKDNETALKPYNREAVDGKDSESIVKSSKGKTGNEVQKVIPIVAKKVPLDPTRYSDVNKTTILNSTPFDRLPLIIREMGYDAIKSLKKMSRGVQEGELVSFDLMGQAKSDGKWREGNYNLKDSPVRGLLYGKDGKIMPNMATAMQLALLDTIRTDKSKLAPGYKNDQSIAAMFQVQEFEVTKKMREFANNVGAFKKTATNSVGKATLALMGITRSNAKDVGMYNYERLVADVGNLALFMGKEQGLLEFTKKESSEIQSLTKDAENKNTGYSDEAKTFFITLKTDEKKVPGTKFIRKEIIPEVADSINKVTKIVEMFPSMKIKERGPLLRPLTGKSLEKQVNTVQNDSSNMEVPKKAQDALKKMMSTEYSMEVERVEEFLKLVDNNNNNAKKVLGFKAFDSKEYNDLMGDDKEIQEAINNNIDKSIEDLRKFLESNKGIAVNGKIPMYFKFVYQTNGRYMLDSNTINPQGNTLHRFLVLPTDMEGSVSANPETGLFTSAKGNDISLQVRFAIGQAFGFDVDKVDPKEIIAYGNDMLGMPTKEVDAVTKDILTKGEAKVVIGEGKNSIEREIKADHLSHTLQALNFIKTFSEGATSIPTFLSEEHDSLTSGFANKLLQMPILDPENEMVMHEHLARVGVITEKYRDANPEHAELVKNGGVGALLGAEGFYDSYKNLAKKVLVKAVEQIKGMHRGKSEKVMFNTVSESLPGNKVILGGDATNAIIDKAMRGMFKDPFMIFNYSASISRIKKNLAFYIAQDVFRSIAKGDAKGISVATKLSLEYPTMYVGKGNDKEKISSAQALRQAVLNNRTSNIYYKPSNENQLKQLLVGLQEMATEVYGNQVEEVFNDEFSQFIEVQNATNDAFKVMFRVFDFQKNELIKDVVTKQGYVSQEDQKNIIESLWKDFPSIMGPLSESGKDKQIIPVTGTALGSPTVITEAATPPQSVVTYDNGVKSNPIVREMAEAVSAGSVVPYHFIDGAEMSEMFETMAEESAILAIHDAVMGDMDGSDDRPFAYNKGMFETNKNYSIIGSIKEKLDRVQAKITKMDKDKVRSIKKLSIEGLKSNLKPEGRKQVVIGKDFIKASEQVFKRFEEIAKNVESTREKWYSKGGVFDNAWFGNMINGTPGALYKPVNSDYKADTSYKDKLVPYYKINRRSESISESNVGKTDTGLNGTDPSTEKTLTLEEFKQLFNLGTNVDISKDTVLQEIFKANKEVVANLYDVDPTKVVITDKVKGGRFTVKGNTVSLNPSRLFNRTTVAHEFIHSVQQKITYDSLSDGSKDFIQSSIKAFKELKHGILTLEEFTEIDEALQADDLKTVTKKYSRSKLEYGYLAHIANGHYNSKEVITASTINNRFGREYTAIIGSSPKFRSLLHKNSVNKDKGTLRRTMKEIIEAVKNVTSLVKAIIKEDKGRFNDSPEYQSGLLLLDEYSALINPEWNKVTKESFAGFELSPFSSDVDKVITSLEDSRQTYKGCS